MITSRFDRVLMSTLTVKLNNYTIVFTKNGQSRKSTISTLVLDKNNNTVEYFKTSLKYMLKTVRIYKNL